VGVNTVLADDPSLTFRGQKSVVEGQKRLRRIILDSRARTPLSSKVVCDALGSLTTIVVTGAAPARRVAALRRRVNVWVAPARRGRVDLRWVLKKLGAQDVTSLLVEGGGEVNATFLMSHLAQRIAFFYAPKVLGGRDGRKAVAGEGARSLAETLTLEDVEWRRLGEDLFLTARVASPSSRASTKNSNPGA
jgi:diaminohydroxyphosphoribosylaminopyrimidine deaminase/5-amino-6-(5-phosphoribosylamino)uracil reductase